jgi:hypothetical protein
MPDVYATRADLFKYGGKPDELANPGRLCASVLASTDTFELDEHGLQTDDPFIPRIETGGAMPAPLVAGVTLYAIRLTDQTFKAAAAPAGAAIDLTTDGVSVVIVRPLPIDEVLEFYSRFVDPFIPAHIVPLKSPYPLVVVATVAKLAFKELQRLNGLSSVSMAEAELGAKAQLERWAKGLPIRDARATASADLAYSEAAPSVGPRNWTPAGGTLP